MYVIVHDRGYDRKITSGEWKAGIWKNVKSQTRRKMQAPKIVTTTGMRECPIPLIELAMQSIIPHKKYVEKITLHLDRPASTTSGLFV